MPSLTLPPWFRAVLFALGGLGLAIWLSVFFHDAKRPTTLQERADRLAASNYAALSLFASLPPSAPHWEQLLVLQAPTGKGRYPIAQEAAALSIALAGGSPRVAAALALAGAALALGWLLGRRPGSRFGIDALIVALALLVVCHSLAWQIRDPHPFLILAFSALALGGWLALQDPAAKKGKALLLGLGLSGLLLSAPALLVCFVAGAAVDLLWRRGLRGPTSAPGSRPVPALLAVAALPVVVTLLALGLRNQAVIGSPWKSPAAYYFETKTSAPVWFWDGTRPPPDNLDPVMERYDEIIMIPRSRWPVPVYKLWLERMAHGAHQAGGLVLTGLALLVVLSGAAKQANTRIPSLLLLGMAAITLLYYPPNPLWWTFLTAPIVWLLAVGFDRASPSPRQIAVAVLLQLAVLNWSTQLKPLDSEYFFKARMDEVAAKIRETPGRHLVLSDFDNSADGRLEAADLPRDWDAYTIIYARDLKPEQNAALVASFPGRTSWRIVIFGNRIGLLRWPPAEPAGASPAPAAPTAASPSSDTAPASTSMPAPAAPPTSAPAETTGDTSN